MTFRQLVFYLLFFSSVALAQQKPVDSETPRRLDLRRFDGTWGATLTCADFKDDTGGAKGYTYRFLVQIKDGILLGEYGQQGSSGSLKYDGRVQPDGTAEIQARGLTGSTKTAVGHVSSGTSYSYRVKAHFDESRGTGTRVDLRPCEVVFVKQ